MKKTLLSLCLLAVCLTAACAQESKIILNGFDSVRELYAIRPAIQLMDGRMDIVDASSGMVKSGRGSACFTYESGSSPYMVLHIGHTAHPDLDLSAVSRMRLCIYSDSSQAVPCQISLVGTDFSPLLAQEYTLQPGQWNEVALPLPAGSFDARQVIGFGLRLDPDKAARFYLDEWSVS